MYRFVRGAGFGRGWGFGFRGASPPWPFVGVGRGGLPRCGCLPYTPPMSKEEELSYLKEQAEAIKEELERIEARVQELESRS